MEAVAEAVMDMQAILLGNKTNVDKLEMRNMKGQYIVWNHEFLPSLSHLAVSQQNSRSCACTFDCV